MHTTCLLVRLFISTKYYQNMSKDIKVMEYTRLRIEDFCFRGDNFTTKWDLSLLQSICLLVFLFIPAKYDHITLNSMGVSGCTRLRLQGRILHKKIVSCLSCKQHAYWSSSPFLPNITKICLRASKLWCSQGWVCSVCFRGYNYIINNVRVVTLACNTPIGPPLHPY